jgi:GntR family transcriptional regulator, transcriptional repressor for pyruvate dehydrogenase complex
MRTETIEATAVASLGLIDVPKSCDVLAERLKQQILGGNYAPGAALPTERELVVTTGLSRGSVREALRILQAQGLVRTRPGRHGGSVASRPSDALLGSHINLFAKGCAVPPHALVEARQALEPMVAYLAAKNRTAADLAELKAIAARLEAAARNNVPQFLEENARWHIAMASATHNDLLRAFMASISELMIELSRLEHFSTPEVRELVTHTHRRIFQAIEAGEADTARRRAERDVQGYAAHLELALKRATPTMTRRKAK